MIRLAAVGFGHEANTFATAKATLAAWQSAGILEGDEIRERYATSESILAGFFAYEAEQPDVEIVPLVFSWITPTGPSTREAFEYLVRRILTAVRESGPWDGVLLPQHGAAVADHHPDADGELLRRVRETVGAHVPIGVTLDMHANISPAMVNHADVITVFQTNPHVDAAVQGLVCARLLGRTIRGEIRPTMALATPPLAINILRQGTDDQPMIRLLQAARHHEERPGVLAVAVAEGFPYADVADMGMSVLVVTDNNAALAREIAGHVGSVAWDMREEFSAVMSSVDDALREADAGQGGPVLLLDVGDNVGAGSAGDSTHLLHAARRLGISGLIVSIYDSDSARVCATADVGARLVLQVGGKVDHRHGTPFPVSGEVIAVANGRFEDPTRTHGGAQHFDLGLSAGLRTSDGYILAIHSRAAATRSLEQFRMVGIEPAEAKIVAAKGVHSPRAAFEPIAKRLIWANTPGATSADLATFAYAHRRRPMFPFEPNAIWSHRTEAP